MTTATEKLLSDALQLPEEERAALAARLLESLDSPPVELDEAWDAEIRRRIDEIESGAVQTIPWEMARRTILGEPDEAGSP